MKIPILPHILKYMGSKREILSFVIDTIQKTGVESNYFCDLFAGTALVGSAFKHQYRVHINDIQSYSSIFAQAYLYNLKTSAPLGVIENIHEKALSYVNDLTAHTPELIADYSKITHLDNLQRLEEQQRELLHSDIHTGFHLFTKYYSGTYWSYEQCAWIDSIRAAAKPTAIHSSMALSYQPSYTPCPTHLREQATLLNTETSQPPTCKTSSSIGQNKYGHSSRKNFTNSSPPSIQTRSIPPTSPASTTSTVSK